MKRATRSVLRNVVVAIELCQPEHAQVEASAKVGVLPARRLCQPEHAQVEASAKVGFLEIANCQFIRRSAQREGGPIYPPKLKEHRMTTNLIDGCAIKRWDLVFLIINCVIGAGIFGLPARIFNLSGVYSIPAILVCAVLILIIVMNTAEVGSQFGSRAGPISTHLSALGKCRALLSAG